MRRSIKRTIHVTEQWISSYAESISAQLQWLNGDLIAPSTMPVAFWREFEIPGMEQDRPLIHGAQHFKYARPVTAGMTLDCELSLIKKENKTGKRGLLTFFTYKLVCSSRDEPVVTSETVLIRIEEGVS